MKQYKQQTIFNEGYLTDLFTKRLNGDKLEKLSNQNLTHIATILGHISNEYALYSVLFEGPNQLLTVEGTQVNTKDLAAFVLMDHTFTRGYFAKTAGGKATSDTTNCQGVPLALEGARRLYGTPYMQWLEGYDLKDTNSMWKVDIFLPAQLGSIILDEDGKPRLAEKYGLIVLYANKVDFPPTVINQLRKLIPGWQSITTPKMVEEGEIEGKYGSIYNKCGYRMRNLILRGWVWQEATRNPDMITNILDWDNYPSRVSFEGMMPATGNAYLNFLGSNLKEEEEKDLTL